MSVSWIAIGDIHISAKPLAYWDSFSQKEWRRFPTWATRLQEAIDQANLDAVDFFTQLGDVVNAPWDTDGWVARLQSFVDQINDGANGLSGIDCYNVIGNHRLAAEEANYFTTIAAAQGTRSNQHPSAEVPSAYTFEINSVRFIVIYNKYNAEMGAAQLTWLEDTALDTSLPVVVLSHAYLHTDMHDYGDPSYAYYNDGTEAATVRGLLEAHGKVQGVLQCHYHRANSFRMINNIPYFSLHGSVLAPIPSDNAFYKFELDPDKFSVGGQSRGHITVTGYGSKAQDVNLVNAFIGA